MNGIPDQISPIIAYRTWGWDAMGLESLNHVRWVPGQAMTAACRLFIESQAVVFRDENGHFRLLHDEAPADGCTCGIYAAKNLRHLHNIGYTESGDIHGEIYLWGKVWDHKLGYRAQYAYPKNLVISAKSMPFQIKDILQHLEPLTLYNVDMWLTADDYCGVEQEHIPLYKKDQGMQADGIHWMIERRKSWHREEKGIAPVAVGDRISIRNKGLGVVKNITNDNRVHVLMFNRVMHSIEGKEFVWNRQNYRWETDSCGYQTYLHVAKGL